MSTIQTWTSLRYRILSSFESRSPAISSYLIKAVLKTRLGARDHLHESLSWIVQSCPTIKIEDRCSWASANPGKAWSVRAKLALDHFLSSVCLFVALRHKSLHRSIANLGVYIQPALQVQPVSTSYRAMVITPSSFKTLSPQLLNPSCIFPFQGGLNRGIQWVVSSNKDAANPWGTGCNLWREDQRGCSRDFPTWKRISRCVAGSCLARISHSSI